MKRSWLILFLSISLGFNLGLVVSRMTEQESGGEEGARRPSEDRRQNPPGPRGDAERPWRGAERPPGDFDRSPGDILLRRIGNELDLTAEQEGPFLELQRRFITETMKTRERVHTLQRNLRTELISGQPDRAKIDHSLEELVAAQASMERLFVETLLASRALLDVDQEQIYLRVMGHLRQMRGEGRRPMRPGEARYGNRFRERPNRQAPGG